MKPLKKLICILILLFFACQSVEKFPKPERVIPEDKMVNMLVDMALLKAAKSTGREQLEASGINPETYFYEKYQVDSILFKNNLSYYTNNLKNYEKIYLRVIDTLEKRSAKMTDLINEIGFKENATIGDPSDSNERDQLRSVEE